MVQSGGGWPVTPDEEAELLAELQEELRLAQVESMVEAESRLIDADVSEHMDAASAAASQGDVVLCPVCTKAWLQHPPPYTAICCPRCGLTLNDHRDGIGLPQLREMLALAYQEHAATCCRGGLCFALVCPPFDSSLTNLAASCDSCAFRYLVL